MQKEELKLLKGLLPLLKTLITEKDEVINGLREQISDMRVLMKYLYEVEHGREVLKDADIDEVVADVAAKKILAEKSIDKPDSEKEKK